MSYRIFRPLEYALCLEAEANGDRQRREPRKPCGPLARVRRKLSPPKPTIEPLDERLQ